MAEILIHGGPRGGKGPSRCEAERPGHTASCAEGHGAVGERRNLAGAGSGGVGRGGCPTGYCKASASSRVHLAGISPHLVPPLRLGQPELLRRDGRLPVLLGHADAHVWARVLQVEPVAVQLRIDVVDGQGKLEDARRRLGRAPRGGERRARRAPPVGRAERRAGHLVREGGAVVHHQQGDPLGAEHVVQLLLDDGVNLRPAKRPALRHRQRGHTFRIGQRWQAEVAQRLSKKLRRQCSCVPILGGVQVPFSGRVPRVAHQGHGGRVGVGGRPSARCAHRRPPRPVVPAGAAAREGPRYVFVRVGSHVVLFLSYVKLSSVNETILWRSPSVWAVTMADYAAYGRFQGGTLDGLRDGKGSCSFANKYFSYNGGWAAGVMQGRGTLTLADGSQYDGAFEKGEMTGAGLRRWATGASYSGQFVQGELHGTGVHISAEGAQYDGQWVAGKRHGHGVFMSTSGDRYTGAFVNHRQSGAR
eukprot:scaffold268_cov134-Isochrysis_galbana.AAC.12